jgi:hypothetical protein
MEEKKPLYGRRIFLAFVIATILFIGAFLIAYEVSYSKSKSIAISQEEIYYNLLNSQLEKQLIIFNCDSFIPYEFATDLSNMGSLLGILEDRFGKNDAKVIKQKEIYSMLELQHYFLIKDYNSECDKSLNTILFFYSNNENFINSAEKIGFILSSLKTQNKEVMIYSFDYDLNLNIIKLLKEKYNITQPNTIIINEEIKITELKTIEELEKNLKKNTLSQVINLN